MVAEGSTHLSPAAEGPPERNRASQHRKPRQRLFIYEPTPSAVTKTATENNLQFYALISSPLPSRINSRYRFQSIEESSTIYQRRKSVQKKLRAINQILTLTLILAGCTSTAIIQSPNPIAQVPSPTTQPTLLNADLSTPIPAPITNQLKLGGKNPQGIEISANSQYLTLNGKPWTPVMAEFHYVRYPQAEWEDEILKMKAGGITVVSTYVIWIYHEEIQGQFDWTGDRDLHQFLQLCAKHGLYAYVRIGPWCHGEVRNGGLPDWLLQKSKIIRRDDPTFMRYTGLYYAQIQKQLAGLLYKDGGPVIGIQLDNEAGNAPKYLLALKNLAVKLGIDVPIYSYTGWDGAKGPPDEMIPMYGGYPDGFWLNEPGVSKSGRRQYVFTHILDDANISENLTSRRRVATPDSQNHYPYLTTEIAGGMAISYARRPTMSADDIAALPLVKIGSGANMPGYYMYHGGRDLIGKLSTLQESQATNYPNDMPEINYDFQAPLGQFGQIRDSYHALRLLHTFLADFGSSLAPMQSFLPTETPSSLSDTQTLRWAVRSNGHSGFIFINNYQRGSTLPDHPNTQFNLKLADGSQLVPATPINIPSNTYMIWPFNLDMNGTLLKSTTTQLLCRLDGDIPTYVFFTIPGVEPRFEYSGSIPEPLDSLFPPGFKIGASSGVVTIPFGTCVFRALDGRQVRVFLLPRDQALRSWKANLWNANRLLISPSNLILDGPRLRLQTDNPQNLNVYIFPSPAAQIPQFTKSPDGNFTKYSTAIAPKNLDVTLQQTSAGSLPRPIHIGKRRKPEPPTDADFATAPTWHITIPPDALDGLKDVILKIDYVGDAARAYIGDQLIDDDFYFGEPWEIGLKRFAPEVLEKGITIKILPRPKNTRIYLQDDRRPILSANGHTSVYYGADLINVEPKLIYEATMP
jgi:beta-galactosidase